ncbi:MAG: DNA polymerase III subunit gamma/tau [Alloprevotella sp.]
MSDYIVSARKYRPATFDAVVGQSSLTTTLKNAIKTGKLAHAYLFCGPRGVGKTTSARIFAKTINCLSLGANGEACDHCESCQAFNEGRSLNIHELDAASNNSVDDIRQLIEQVQVPPQIGRYKVFIIDEVHMLSPAAFNAFLKTLEEPPAHAIFILATTEKHKILPTILSRCQIYDFNRMEVGDMIQHLKKVAEREGYSYEEEALGIIAQKADGGMRDALSIFDQVASYTQGNITYGKVIENLNILDYDHYFRLTESLLKCDIPQVMLSLNDILSRGFEGNHVIGGLASHFRNLLVSRDAQTLPLLEVAESVRQRYQEQALRCTPKFLYAALKLCNNCDLNYRAARNKRLLVEITLIETAQLSLPENADDASGGRSPIRRLLPIFAPAPAQAAGAQRIANARKSPHEAAAQQPTAGNSPAAPAQPLTAQQAQPATTAPTIRRSSGMSRLNTVALHRTTATAATERQAAAGSPMPTTDNPATAALAPHKQELQPFSTDELQHYWLLFANQLPANQGAEAGRLQMIVPTLKEDFCVEAIVDNERAAKHLEIIQPRLTGFLRSALHNDAIRVVFRVDDAVITRYVASPREALIKMCEENPAITTLIKKLKLQIS